MVCMNLRWESGLCSVMVDMLRHSGLKRDIFNAT